MCGLPVIPRIWSTITQSTTKIILSAYPASYTRDGISPNIIWFIAKE